MALILAIEDHDDVLTLLSFVLKDHQVLLAPDSTSGLRMAKDLRPDLVLLDLGMPDVDGLEVCRALRREPATADLPIIFVTARIDMTENEAAWQAVGAQGAISKPFSPTHLLSEVERVLAGRMGGSTR
ncbi:MAG TPA: response regulator [Chloroflexota bacterium]|jgi:CheY-like chemotaxis protein